MLRIDRNNERYEIVIVISDKHLSENLISRLAVDLLETHKENPDLELYDSSRVKVSDLLIAEQDEDSPKRLVIY